MSLRMEKKFKELGGVIRYNKGVEEIVLEGGNATGVKFADGSFVEADYVIPTVDTHILSQVIFRELLPYFSTISGRIQPGFVCLRVLQRSGDVVQFSVL